MPTLLDRIQWEDKNQTRSPRPDLSSDYSAASNELEKTLTEIWEDVLQVVQVGIDDDFFELGGNSLLAVAIITRLHQASTRCQLSPNVLFEAPTIRLLAQRAHER